MTEKQAVKLLRTFIGKRGVHHPNCNVHCYPKNKTQCDCYARDREKAHEALDLLTMVRTK